MNAPGPLPFPADGHAPAGHRLNHFELRGVVARGSHGYVHRAWDHELGIAVAIKEYLPKHLAGRDAVGDVQALSAEAAVAFHRGREAFIEETRLLARCDHASLLRVRQLLRMHGTVYRVMPWCQGWPLAELRREMATPPDEAALRRLIDEVLGALETWHRIGGTHGGVNPAKILLLDDDRALLLGPGLARREAAAGAPLTPDTPELQFGRGFLAPEQRLATSDAAHALRGPWTDFHALASVVRYCITGMLPTPDATAEPLASIVEALYFDAPDVRYDARLLLALDAAASPAIADRPHSATEFRDWLEHGPRPRAVVAVADEAPEAPEAPEPPEPPEPPTEPRARADEAVAEAAALIDLPLPAAPVTSVDLPIDVPVDVPVDGPIEASAPTPKNEAVDNATVDLIRRVIEAIPERQAPPKEEAEAMSVFSEPLLRVNGPMDTGWSPLPRRKSTGKWWLLAAVVVGAVGYAAWEWGVPAWQGLEAYFEQHGTPAAVSSETRASEPLASAAPASAAEREDAPAPVAQASAPEAEAVVASAPVAEAGAETGAGPERVAQAPEAPAAQAVKTVASSTPVPDAAPAVVTLAASSPEAPVRTAEPAPPAPVPARAPAPPPTRRAATATASATAAESPRQTCGSRKEFALYRCMQQQCAKPDQAQHAQCVQFKASDRID